jgi:NADPH:quinone reductase-like Zn-dependent oxidoreductase
LVGLTAWQALIERANLQQGQRILVHAGSGGVGTIAIQLAKHLGATVATTTSAANAELVRSLGADIVVDYKKDDFEKHLRDYDVVLCSLDAKILEKSLAILKPGGKLISISGPPDPTFAEEAKLNWLIKQVLRVLSASIRRKAQRKQVSYSFLFMRSSGEQLQRISSLVESGALQPVIDKIYSLVAAKDALAYVDTGRSRGKVVIKVLES